MTTKLHHGNRSRRRHTLVHVAWAAGMAAGALTAVPAQIFGDTFSWVPTSGTQAYNEASNWNPATVPGTADNAVFANDFNGTVTFGASLGAGTVTFGNTSGAIAFDLQGNAFTLDKIFLLGTAAGQVNDVTIMGGGTITQTSSVAQSLFTVGFAGSHGNRLTLSGANTTLLGRTAAATTSGNVGVAGSNNNVLTIRDGARLLQSADIIVGTVGADASTGNEVNILNATFGSNSVPANALRGFQLINGTLNITNSTFQAVRFNASAVGNNTTINFNSGTWFSRACSILNGKVFTIGDGGATPATFYAYAGNATLLTGNGIVINSNGVLSGTTAGTGSPGIGGNVSGVAGAKIAPHNPGGDVFSTSDDIPTGTLIIKGNLDHQNIETTLQVGDISSGVVNAATELPADRLIVTAGSIVGQSPTPTGTYNFDGGTFTHGGTIKVDLGIYVPPQDQNYEIRLVSWSSAVGDPANTTVQFVGGSPLPFEFRADGFYLTTQAVVANSQWNVDADGNWTTAGNWLGAIPYAAGGTANFGTVITAPRTVTLNANVAVAALNFTSPIGYTIAGSATLAMDALSGNAAINVTAGAHTISAPVTLNDDLNVTVTPADSSVSFTGELVAAGRTISKLGAGAAQFENVRANALTVSAGTARISTKGTANAPQGTSRLNTLAIDAAARLDLNNNSLVVDSGTLSTITGLVKTALENGGNFDWLGPGIGSTQANVQNTTAGSFLYGLGVVLNDLSQVGGTGPIYTDFAGISGLVGNEVLVKFTYFGDADLSGSIDATDYSLIDNGYVNSLSGWLNGDFDYSGSIDATDYALIDNAYVNQAGPLAEAMIAEHARMFGGEYLAALRAIQSGVIPEPSAIGGCVGIAIVASGGLRRRRANRRA